MDARIPQGIPATIPFIKGTDAEMSLPITWVPDPGIWIYSLNLMGQAAVNHHVAQKLYEQICEKGIVCDLIVTLEAKAIAIAQELAVLLGHKRYVVIRKSVKAYMGKTYSAPVRSITTSSLQMLYLDEVDAALLRSAAHPIFFDDVISTGASFRAADELARFGAGKGFDLCICAATEGIALADNPEGFLRLGHLPVYNAQGESL